LVITLQLSRYPARTLEEYIRKWRLEQGLLQVDLAKKINVNEMTIVNWEKGKTKPDKKKFEKLRTMLGNSMPSAPFDSPWNPFTGPPGRKK
jgi:ribosome-binding protein aMBF1 (putative translation factor)